MAPRFEWYKDPRNRFRWHLKADGNIIASSGERHYKSRDEVLRAIELVKNTAVGDALVVQVSPTLTPLPADTAHMVAKRRQDVLNRLSIGRRLRVINNRVERY